MSLAVKSRTSFLLLHCYLVLSPLRFESEPSSWSLVTLSSCYLVTLFFLRFATKASKLVVLCYLVTLERFKDTNE